MSEHQKDTAFLRHCIRYDDTDEHKQLEEGITQIQRDERCVRQAVWMMAIPGALSLAGLGYGAALVDNFPYNTPQYVINLICALGIASLISLLAFIGLGMVYRRRLDQRREECRRFAMKLLESRLGQPVVTPSRDMRDKRASDGNRETAHAVITGNGSSIESESIRSN
jgi:hypothetical protein